MFENITYKKKFIALIVLLVLMAITAYKRSYGVAIDAYQSLKSSREKLKEVTNSQERIALLKSEVDYLDNIIGKQAANEDLVQQEIMNSFPTMGKGAELVRLEEVHAANDEYFNIYTNRLVLTGNFNSLLRATYQYEKEFEFSRVVSLKFSVERQVRTRKKRLFEHIIFQNYEKTN